MSDKNGGKGRRLAGRLQRGAIHAIESPFLLTVWVAGLATVAILGIAILDALQLPWVAGRIPPHLHDILAWFPGDLIVMAIFVLILAHGARWIARQLARIAHA